MKRMIDEQRKMQDELRHNFDEHKKQVGLTPQNLSCKKVPMLEIDNLDNDDDLVSKNSEQNAKQ